jgi:hypothetical protein
MNNPELPVANHAAHYNLTQPIPLIEDDEKLGSQIVEYLREVGSKRTGSRTVTRRSRRASSRW